jgi:hypothetical protein
MKFTIGEYVMVKESPTHYLTGKCRIVGAEFIDLDLDTEQVVYQVRGLERITNKKLMTQTLIEDEMEHILPENTFLLD